MPTRGRSVERDAREFEALGVGHHFPVPNSSRRHDSVQQRFALAAPDVHVDTMPKDQPEALAEK
jgi:hypothetical protein